MQFIPESRDSSYIAYSKAVTPSWSQQLVQLQSDLQIPTSLHKEHDI